jgi:hypothetical protein
VTPIPRKWYPAFCVFLSLFLLETTLSFALDPRFEIDTETLRPKTAQPTPPKSGAKPQTPARKKTVGDLPGNGVKGKRATRSAKARSLKTVVHARKARGMAHRPGNRAIPPETAPGRDTAAGGSGYHTLRMMASPRSAQEDIQLTRNAWRRIVAEGGTQQAPLRVEGGNFSLSLDPERYPLLPAADGGKILVDAEGTLPPFVKDILREKEPGVRIVSETPSNLKRFFSALLSAARFYSVEDNFSVHFGSDPKVTVTSDFKIEKSPESLLNNDVILLNIAEKRMGLPPSLTSQLEKEGFHVVDLSPRTSDEPSVARHVLYSVTSGTQQGIADAILSVFSVTSQPNRDIELDDGSLSGVRLSVRVDRYLETGGRKVLLSFNEANPVQYTLLKLLQLKGYQVVTIHPTDDFRKVSEKVLSALRISASFGTHHLGDSRESSVDVQLSGFVVGGAAKTEGSTFLTNVGVDPLIREIAGFKGYTVIDK